jgi:hypothetical protein
MVLLGFLLCSVGCAGSDSSSVPSDSTRNDGTKKADPPSEDPQFTAKSNAARAQLKLLHSAMATYYVHHSAYPPDLATLTKPDEENDKQPFLKPDQLRDPWGKPYLMDVSGPEPLIFTKAPDGKRISSADK